MTQMLRTSGILALVYPYQKLLVWQRARAVAAALYQQPELDAPRFRSLGEQMRRSAVSISANIAEGAGSESRAGYCRYLGIALASAYELESLFILAGDAGFAAWLDRAQMAHSISAVKGMLVALRRKVRAGSGS